jgi:hypothetical protein
MLPALEFAAEHVAKDGMLKRASLVRSSSFIRFFYDTHVHDYVHVNDDGYGFKAIGGIE